MDLHAKEKTSFSAECFIHFYTQYERNRLSTAFCHRCSRAVRTQQNGSMACLQGGLQRERGGLGEKEISCVEALPGTVHSGGKSVKRAWLCVIDGLFHHPVCTVQAPDYISSLSSPLSLGMWIMGLDKMIKISLVS